MKIIKLIITIVFCACLLISCDRPPQQSGSAAQVAPNFVAKDKNGVIWNLAQLRGKVVLVHFWATWCPPCREEMPKIAELSTTIASDKLQILAISYRDDPALVKMIVDTAGWTLPFIEDADSRISAMYELTGVPETFIIDKNGLVRERIIGPMDWDSPQIRQKLTEYMAE
ncbi:MAG: TlpA family protein disulfide reductase [Desulfobulbaceae bacterium]|nr:TlpA family protein disulfide reductase [Desulfobulbaceae bacterium]